MATVASRVAHSKATERRIQRILWPGSERPWKDRWDLHGLDAGGKPWYGEAKEARKVSLTDGLHLLRGAVEQLCRAVDEDEAAQAGGLFVVIHQVGSPTDWVWVVAGDITWGPYTLEEFRERWLLNGGTQ
jgi:hypothetical protein